MSTHASHITTHVLDAASGRPAEGITVRLEAAPEIAEGTTGQGWSLVASSRTNDDGRVPQLGPETLVPGTYRLVFDTAEYFDRRDTVSFYRRSSSSSGWRALSSTTTSPSCSAVRLLDLSRS